MLVYQNQKLGNVLKAGDFIGIIGADPVFVLEGPLPLYRDLNLGDNGDDVLAFQKALNSAGYATAQSGTVTEDTLEAVTRLHRAHLTGVPGEGSPALPATTTRFCPPVATPSPQLRRSASSSATATPSRA